MWSVATLQLNELGNTTLWPAALPYTNIKMSCHTRCHTLVQACRTKPGREQVLHCLPIAAFLYCLEYSGEVQGRATENAHVERNSFGKSSCHFFPTKRAPIGPTSHANGLLDLEHAGPGIFLAWPVLILLLPLPHCCWALN